jgi:cytochrome c biogenesis protein CcmG/thiol:disulfide interchange protein DsbE
MPRPRKYRRRRGNNPAWVALGVGLILIGLALWVVLSRPDNASNSASSASGRSAVPVAVRYAAPDLALMNLDGDTESLADLRQDVVLVNNWATWCPPCKEEMPVLEAYYETHAAEGFTIVAVEAGDALEDVSEFARGHALKFHVWLDPKNASMDAFKSQNLPSSFVIDRTGTVRYAWIGAISREMLEKYVTPLLTEDQ